MLNIFHISDLHFSTKANQSGDAANAIISGILELASDLKNSGALSHDVLVFITGDFVQSGSSAEKDSDSDFNQVNEILLKPLMKILEIAPENIYIVPGNHEIDRVAVQEQYWITFQKFREEGLSDFNIYDDLKKKLTNFVNFIEANGYKSINLENPRIRHFEQNQIPIVIFNGLVGSYSRSGNGDKGELFISPTENGKLFSRIPEHSVILLHHPLSWFDDTCGLELKNIFASKKCRLITGHIHGTGATFEEVGKGSLAQIQAGVSAEAGDRNDVAVLWLPNSQSATVRHYSYCKKEGKFPLAGVEKNAYLPSKSKDFFSRTSACFEPSQILMARERACDIAKEDFKTTFGKTIEYYVTPDMITHGDDHITRIRKSFDQFTSDANNKVICGDDLSGKSSFIVYNSVFGNDASVSKKLHLHFDLRTVSFHKLSFLDVIKKKINSLNIPNINADYIIENGQVELWFDNFNPDDAVQMQSFSEFIKLNPRVNWAVGVRGDQRFTPLSHPVQFPANGVSYYEMSEITVPTALKMISKRANNHMIENPRLVVERVFKSINNLRAPRTVFYVDSLITIFMDDASVEPLNRYLLIENLLSDRIRAAHKDNIPNQPVDMEMIETFIGIVAYEFLDTENSLMSKGRFLTLVEEFIDRKGIQTKRFEPELILKILQDSFVLRDYDGDLGFMMISVEDYFLAKHMARDADFRARVMTTEGLLTYPSIAEYYIAQNPSDKVRIDEIFKIIGEFEKEARPLIDQLKGESLQAIQTAFRGKSSEFAAGLYDVLAQAETPDEDAILISEAPKSIGRSKRLRFSIEERGAVFLQLGASILGVSRTLDKQDRIEIFNKLREILLISFQGIPMIAEHLASGGEIILRGASLKADFVGALANEPDRFYIILRAMLYNVMKRFSTWAGSYTFYRSAFALLNEEQDELIAASLFAQNIEADLAEAINTISQIENKLQSVVIKEVVIRLYADAMMLVPLDSTLERRALDGLVDETIKLFPPSGNTSEAMVNIQKAKARQDFIDKIGLSYYVGKNIKMKKANVPAISSS